MTFRDWAVESAARYRKQDPVTATRRSTRAFGKGVIRRTLDPYVGQSIWEREYWDVCVVCDAARPDLFREAIAEYDALPDRERVATVWSNASCSVEWLERTFDESRDLGRIGYVTANPFTDHDVDSVPSADLSAPPLGHLRKLYETEWATVEGVQTVPPERVTDHAIDAWRRRDELGIDKLVVHYMQPHEPFRARPEWGGGDHALLEDLISGEKEYAGESVYPRVRAGDVSLNEFRAVYLDNHHWVLEELAERLVPNLDGRVAVTADHANGLGEWGAWHHPPGSVAPAIRKVPWVTLQASDRETVTPDVGERAVEASTSEQLEALGYV